jgi:hypothetical protein
MLEWPIIFSFLREKMFSLAGNKVSGDPDCLSEIDRWTDEIDWYGDDLNRFPDSLRCEHERQSVKVEELQFDPSHHLD